MVLSSNFYNSHIGKIGYDYILLKGKTATSINWSNRKWNEI